MHQTGKATIIAVASGARLPHLPAVPTIDEAGVKGFNSTTFFSLMAPPKTPIEIRTKLNAAIVAGMAVLATQTKLEAQQP